MVVEVPSADVPTELGHFGLFGPGESPTGYDRAQTVLEKPETMCNQSHHNDELRRGWKRQ
jgi:hypothetical protein